MHYPIEVAQLSPAIGAEIRGVDLAREVDDACFGRVRQAWRDHLVLLFRGQRLDDAALVRFTSRFGALEIVPTHPGTGRKVLYLGRRANAKIEGLPTDESEALLDALWAHAIEARFAWHHQWRAGDLIVWDNRCTLHRRDSFDESHRRVMHRTQSRGTRPN
jgi:alpha-ketoglutarate-dependent taurine dioxygenase